MFLLFVDTSDVKQIGLELSLESVQCTGKLFHGDGPTTAKFHWPIVVQALGTCSRSVEANLRC